MNRRPSAKRLFNPARIALVLGALVPLLAGTAAEPPEPANRFLLVVETSRSMQRRVQAMTQTVRDLLGTGLGGQAQPGDSLGVWTFNEELHTGLLPLQEWSNRNLVRDRVVGFLAAQKFEKRARLDQVIPALQRVVRNSPFLTVILVCLGDEEIHGTPFDAQLNGFFRTWNVKEPDAGTPFVIGLRAQNGKLVDCSMNPYPWPVELPALPKELLVARNAGPRPTVREPAKPPAPKVAPLIISGRKREAQPAAKTEVAVTNVPSAASAPALTAGTPAGPGNGTPSGDGAKAVPNSVASAADTNPKVLTPAAADAGAAASPAVKLPATDPGGPGPALNATAAPPEVTKPALEPPSRPAGAVPIVEPSAKPVAGQLPKEAAAAKASPEPGRLTAPEIAAPEPRPLEVAAATPSPSRVSWPVLAGLGVLAVSAAGAAVYYVWRRRARPGDEISLITESFDRGKRPRG